MSVSLIFLLVLDLISLNKFASIIFDFAPISTKARSDWPDTSALTIGLFCANSELFYHIRVLAFY